MTLLQRTINGVKSEIWTAIEPIDGKKKWFNTGSANKRTARANAKLFYDGLRQGKIDEVAALVKRKAKVLTIGEFLEKYEELCVARNAWDSGVRRVTWTGYCSGLRMIVRHGLGMDFANLKKRGRNALIDRQPLTVLTDGLVIRYINAMQAQAKGTQELATIKRSIYSRHLCAKSLFCPKTAQVFAAENILLPNLSSFVNYRVERGTAVRFKAPKDKSLAARTEAAARDLKVADPEAFKMYLLARNAGLRKSEIVNARVSWLGDHEVNIQSTHSYLTKNGQDREMLLTPEIYAELLELTKERSVDEHILIGTQSDRVIHTPARLNKWLTELGWTRELTGSSKKLHALRANYISSMAKRHGILVAQHLAGHADYSTTDRYYADPDVKVAREA